MLSLIGLPAKIIAILEANVSPREVAFGACLGVFLGFIPLNGPMALFLGIIFFVFRINRVATLITLPIFKSIYFFGAYKLTDKLGESVLTQTEYLNGFWRWITHLPVVAYLGLNNTLVAGGIVFSTILSIPVYFATKRLIIFISRRYSEKIKNSKLARFIPGLKFVGFIGDDYQETIDNVKRRVKLTVKSKIQQTISSIRPKRKAVNTSVIKKRINIPGLVAIVLLLVLFHFSIGFFVSPAFSGFIVENVNKYSNSKIEINRVNIWPLTLSISLKSIKVFDPKNEKSRIAKIDDGIVRISLLGLLSGRLVFSQIYMKGAEINLEGTPDGSFNISRLGAAQKSSQTADSTWRSLFEKKDSFGKMYELMKKKIQSKKSNKVTKSIEQLPKGKIVHFNATKDFYVFEIKKLDITDAYVKIKMDSETLEVTRTKIRLARMAYDPENGINVDLFNFQGDINKTGKLAGKVDIFFSNSYNQSAVFKADFRDVDMNAVRFVYKDSLPVSIVKGLMTLSSRTSIKSGLIDSNNEMCLRDHTINPKVGAGQLVGFIPISTVCDAVNQVNPLQIKFKIAGTLDKPELIGFQEALMKLLKPYLANFQKNIKSEGLSALGKLFGKKDNSQDNQVDAQKSEDTNQTVNNAVDSIKSLFGDKKE